MKHVMVLIFALIATVALAHSGVQNPAVKARMLAMGVIGQNTKTLGEMVKGTTGFDAAAARAAAARIAEQAQLIEALFATPEDDPKSEALPVIWQTYADFVVKADALDAVAGQAAAGIATPQELAAALAQIGSACKSCHAAYRE